MQLGNSRKINRVGIRHYIFIVPLDNSVRVWIVLFLWLIQLELSTLPIKNLCISNSIMRWEKNVASVLYFGIQHQN